MGGIENMGADGEIPLANDDILDLEQQGPPRPPPSPTASILSLPGSRLLDASDCCTCTDWQILLSAAILSVVIIGFMFAYWSYQDI